MGERIYLDGRVVVHAGDCLEVLKTLADDSVDSVVTDPPYHLTSIVKRFGGKDAAPAQYGKDGAFRRCSTGFMGRTWDGGDVAFRPELWAQVLRVLKPGGHIAAFGGTRTYHKLACAIEDAGFEIRDQLQWIFGSGFPKSHDVSKAIDKDDFAITVPAAKQWDGWGTALKPAHEPICLARKPLSEKTVAANVLRWGTGALNIDGCKIGFEIITTLAKDHAASPQSKIGKIGYGGCQETQHNGRWPANLCHDGSPEVLACFPESESRSGETKRTSGIGYHGNGMVTDTPSYGRDSGSASRFFYCAKASKADRCGSRHPTVKPLKLLQWLVRLITPPGGTVLDCFAGTGTTGQAAYNEGFKSVLIEREVEYLADIERRMSFVSSASLFDLAELAKIAIDTQSDITVKLPHEGV